MLRTIQIPKAVRIMLPAIISQMVVLLKDSLETTPGSTYITRGCSSRAKRENAMSYFTHYWSAPTVEDQRTLAESGATSDVLDHTASNQFRSRGTGPGDSLYVISFSKSVLRVIGKMTVGQVVSQEEAERILPYKLWEADDHCIAIPGSEGMLRFDVSVSEPQLAGIEFVSASGLVVGPARGNDGRVDPQTFRGVREITPTTATLFDSGLASY